MRPEVAPVRPSKQAAVPRSPQRPRRQQERDHLLQRGALLKSPPISSAVREIVDPTATKNDLAPAPTKRPNPSAVAAGDMSNRLQLRDGVRKDNPFNRLARREAEDGKVDITPDGGSAGREGRQFTVANVGNNGRIYLRPTIRPANIRYPQPPFVFPATPPSTAGLDVLVPATEEDSLRDSLWTDSHSPSALARHVHDHYFPRSDSIPHPPRRRAHSFSTVDEHHVPVRESDVGAFKVMIGKPATGPKLPVELVPGVPTLEVPIPSYRLGTPRFSTRGTAFLRGSSYTTTDDMRSSVLSVNDLSQRVQTSQRAARILSRRHSDASPQPHYPLLGTSNPSDSSSMPSPAGVPQRRAITPEMFDTLTFKPACDHPSVVRYSVNGGIKAATPARLVAEITSPTFVDYDLLSDFFLTFRSYLETADLLHMLIARLKWALARDDETGTIVRVRTFVAIRHWILNYFLDDYVIDYELRKSFCDLLNNFEDGLSQHPMRTRAPLKIIGEIKKCWRRVCSLYWDDVQFETEPGIDVPILPGGIAGCRNPKLDPSFWEPVQVGPPRLDGIVEPDFVGTESFAATKSHYFADVSRAGHLDSMMAKPEIVLAVPTVQAEDLQEEPSLTRTSILSDDFVSCSLPSRTRMPASARLLGAHPVPASSVYDGAPTIATTPKALTGKRVRPSHAHKRSGSFSDSFRDRRPQQEPVQKVLYKNTEILLALPYAGSLVRGNLFPPAQAVVELIAPSTPSELNQSTLLAPKTRIGLKGPSAMSGPGMKKLLGSVRRALRNRTGNSPSSSPTQGSFPHIPPLGVRGATINRLPGTAVVPQERPRNFGVRAPVRIDLLGAEVAEDFKRAVQEDAEGDGGKREAIERESNGSEHDLGLHYSEMRPDTTLEQPKSANRKQSDGAMTTGSESIVIIDDTLPLDLPVMAGALPTAVSVDTFVDGLMQPSGGPTPPSTPPELSVGTPRRSSHLLGEHTARERSRSAEPSAAPTVESRPSLEHERLPSNWPLRGPSLRSRGKKSISLRRYASYHSGITHHKSVRSLDGSTFSEVEEPDRPGHTPPAAPLPLRVLRRRPGGDLRAVNNVVDLNTQILRRTMSTGSLTTYSDSVRSSYLFGEGSHSGDPLDLDTVNQDYNLPPPAQPTFSLGALAEPSAKRTRSLFSTHSSQPVMRPSFEKEAQLLAQIPDDVDDDGGVESALLKLEGKFEQRRSDTSAGATSGDINRTHNSFGTGPLDTSRGSIDDERQDKQKHRQEHVVERNVAEPPPLFDVYQPRYKLSGEELKPTVYQPQGMQPQPVDSSPRSSDSYNSTPLLDRDLKLDVKPLGPRRDWSGRSLLRSSSFERPGLKEHTPQSSHPNSFDFITETESMRRIPASEMVPSHESMDQSFLDSDSDDDVSDLSSELSLEVISRTEYTERDSASSQTFPPIRPGTVIKEMALPSHPLRHPPSPPMTMVQALHLSPNMANIPQVHDSQPRQDQNPLSPVSMMSPITPAAQEVFSGTRGAAPSVDPLRSHWISEPSRKTSVHLPFILAFDSQILAQQFTLIEKDALNEIDWKDLIEMRWKDTTTEIRSWVEFLRSSEPRGAEVVIARFNIMVKWAVSECVLTQDLDERVQCIVKYIHIAAHCRRYRNFATMTQLTVALTSKDISRLTETWAQVPQKDTQTLRELEALVTPTSNFHNMRAEMEGSGADQGCIPFVGIYTHDLLVNSERPSQIASTPTTEPLVNFERCRTEGTIIKNLLRLLEASQLYRFLPIEGITERCLWMAALSDEEIARFGRMIQE